MTIVNNIASNTNGLFYSNPPQTSDSSNDVVPLTPKPPEQNDSVQISQKAKTLQQEFENDKTTLEDNYNRDAEALERAYLQEKNQLEREFSQKKRALEINIYA